MANKAAFMMMKKRSSDSGFRSETIPWGDEFLRASRLDRELESGEFRSLDVNGYPFSNKRMSSPEYNRCQTVLPDPSQEYFGRPSYQGLVIASKETGNSPLYEYETKMIKTSVDWSRDRKRWSPTGGVKFLPEPGLIHKNRTVLGTPAFQASR